MTMGRRPGLVRAVYALGGVTAVAGMVGILADFWWVLGLFAHFRAQYAAVLLLCAAAAWGLRRRLAAGAFAALAGLNLAFLWPLLAPPPAGPTPALRVMLANVHRANGNHRLLPAAVRQYRPDVLVLLEVDDGWLRDLAGLRAAYPYRIARPRDDNFGIALFSRRPLRRPRLLHLGTPLPTVAAEVDAGGRLLTVLGTHPPPALSARLARLQSHQFDELARFTATSALPVLLVGDLNTTPWSGAFRRLVQRGRLANGARGRRVLMTWPTVAPPLAIPIDHALHTAPLAVTGFRTGPSIGSDHYPIVVDVGWAAQERE